MKMSIIFLLVIFILVGCQEKTACSIFVEKENYREAIDVCGKSLRETKGRIYLKYFIVASGESDRFDLIEPAVNYVNSQDYAAEALLLAARIAESKERLDYAEHYYGLSLNMYQRIHDSANLAIALDGLYYVSYLKSDYSSALVYASRSLDAARKAKDTQSEIRALNDLFVIFQDVGSIGPAEHALSLIESKLEARVKHGWLSTWTNKGILYMHKKEYALALLQFEKSLRAAEPLGDRKMLRSLHLDNVWAYLELGNLSQAEAHLTSAWGYANEDGSASHALYLYKVKLHVYKKEYQLALSTANHVLALGHLEPRWRLEIQYWAGKAAQALGNKSEAIALFKASIESIEELRQKVFYADLQSYLSQYHRKTWEALFVEYFKENKFDNAFYASEYAKSRGFMDAYIQNYKSQTISKEEFPIDSLIQRLDSLAVYLTDMKKSAVNEVVTLDRVFNGLGERSLLSYFMAEGNLYLISFEDKQMKISRLDISASQLDNIVFAYQENMDSLEILEQLGNTLLPDELIPKTGTHIFISPDESISGVAFASIRKRSQYLIERNTLSLVPGIGATSTLVKINQNGDKINVVLGDPKNDLPYSRNEAYLAAEALEVKAFMGPNASLEKVSAQHPLGVLHIASHSGIDHLGPWLMLAEGKVPASRVLTNKINANLVVLTSCASGVGVENNYWGSLGGTFLTSGVPSVVVSLRSVEDKFTSELIADFYASFDGVNASLALAKAQRKAIARRVKPKMWSAYAVLGLGSNY